MTPWTPLFHPREYFENHSEPLLPGLGIVVLYGIAGGALAWAIVNQLLEQMENVPSGVAGEMNEIVSQTVVLSFVTLAITLLVIAAFMHYTCGGSDTGGSFEDAVAVAGWAYAPNLLELPIRYLLVRNTISGLELNLEDTQQFTSEIQSFQNAVTISTLLTTLVVIGWSVYILSKGTAGTHDVDLEKTFFPAVVVGVGALLFQLI